MNNNKILFVEDDLNPEKEIGGNIKEILDNFKKILKKYGKISEAYSFQHAKKLLSSNNFSLAIVDILLPENNNNHFEDDKKWGYELIKELNKKNIPVIGISNKIDYTTVSELTKYPYNVIHVIDKNSTKLKIFESKVTEALSPKNRDRFCSSIQDKCKKQFYFRGEKSIFVISSEEKKDILKLIYDNFKDKFNIRVWYHTKGVTARYILCDNICNELYGNKIILGEISDLNENVFFELGFALGLGREIVMLKLENIKIDLGILKDIQYNNYNDLKCLKKILEKIDFSKPYSIYSTPNIFQNIEDFDNPQTRKKEKFFVVTWDERQININIKYEKITLKYHNNLDRVVSKLINGKGVVFILESNNKIDFQLLFIAGICFSQGIPVNFFIPNNTNIPIDIKHLILETNSEIEKFLRNISLRRIC